MRRLLALIALATSVVACSRGGDSGNVISGPSISTPPPVVVPVMAPPPAGVSPGVWKVAFIGGRTLYRPDAVHLDVSGFDSTVRSVFTEMVSVAIDATGGRTPIDLAPSSTGATFKVILTPNLLCNGRNAGGCADVRVNGWTGIVTGGTIEFSSLAYMRYGPLVLHEIFHAFGLSHSPVPGIMAVSGWSQPRPSDEERLMLLGRYDYPLLAEYSPGVGG